MARFFFTRLLLPLTLVSLIELGRLLSSLASTPCRSGELLLSRASFLALSFGFTKRRPGRT